MTEFTESGESFSNLSILNMNTSGQFVRDAESQVPVETVDLKEYFDESIKLPFGVTDVYVWVHGWQSDADDAEKTAKKLFANLSHWLSIRRANYPNLGHIVPAFIAIHWPSKSTIGPWGYSKIRNRAAAMTEKGSAEYLLTSLLGYLDSMNFRGRSGQAHILQAKDGFYVHCLAHSFGGRFHLAAITAAANPSANFQALLSSVNQDTPFQFTVDSLLVFQMAAPNHSFEDRFVTLLDKAPLSGPVVLTYSDWDRANCIWHAAIEWTERGVGCSGLKKPANRIGWSTMKAVDEPYDSSLFNKDITNVDASQVFTADEWIQGGHSNIWHQETLHLIATLTSSIDRQGLLTRI